MDLSLNRYVGEAHIVEDNGLVSSLIEGTEFVEVGDEKGRFACKLFNPSSLSNSAGSNDDGGLKFCPWINDAEDSLTGTLNRSIFFNGGVNCS